MKSSIKNMNKSLYAAAAHMVEASKYLSNIEEFGEESNKIMLMAIEMADTIVPEPEKVKPQEMKDILSEIMQHGN
jgi:hypothetical protein